MISDSQCKFRFAKMRFLLLVIAVTLGGCSCCFKGPSGSEDSESTPNALKLPQLPSEPEAQWNPFEPLNGWSVKSEVPNRHYRLRFFIQGVPSACGLSLTWVFHLLAQLPNSHLPRQNRSDSGTLKIQVNLTLEHNQRRHSVHCS